MYDMKNLAKFKKLAELAPEAFAAFGAFDTAALRAGGAMTHGTHTLA